MIGSKSISVPRYNEVSAKQLNDEAITEKELRKYFRDKANSKKFP